MAYVRKYKTGSGATGVQVCYKEYGRVVKVVQVGSAHTEQGIKKLEEKARKIMAAGQNTLFGLDRYREE